MQNQKFPINNVSIFLSFMNTFFLKERSNQVAILYALVKV